MFGPVKIEPPTFPKKMQQQVAFYLEKRKELLISSHDKAVAVYHGTDEQIHLIDLPLDFDKVLEELEQKKESIQGPCIVFAVGQEVECDWGLSVSGGGLSGPSDSPKFNMNFKIGETEGFLKDMIVDTGASETFVTNLHNQHLGEATGFFFFGGISSISHVKIPVLMACNSQLALTGYAYKDVSRISFRLDGYALWSFLREVDWTQHTAEESVASLLSNKFNEIHFNAEVLEWFRQPFSSPKEVVKQFFHDVHLDLEPLPHGGRIGRNFLWQLSFSVEYGKIQILQY